MTKSLELHDTYNAEILDLYLYNPSFTVSRENSYDIRNASGM